MAIAYQYNASGYFVGEVEDYGLLPNNATYTAPPQKEGYVARWTGKQWELAENHKGESGYVDGQPYTIKDYGLYPDGWSTTPPEPTEAEKAALRKAKILTRLDAIDTESVRPLRAIARGEGTDMDTAKLAALDAEAATLRGELAAQTKIIERA